MHVYLFSDGATAGERQMLGTYIRKGKERITWIQKDPENMLTRRWFEPGREPLFDPGAYDHLKELE